MEKAVGIICECNPFHFGHAHLIREVKRAFPQKTVLCLMSGNFVQRGSFAIQEKYSRAKCALLCGADLVLELPFPFSCLSAESFAESAVHILTQSSLCDTLAFGSEIPRETELLRCAENLLSPDFDEAYLAYSASHPGEGYPAAREKVYRETFGESPCLSQPNASLAVAYLSACLRQKNGFSFFAVERKGEGARSLDAFAPYASATALRRLAENGESLAGYVPDPVWDEIRKEKAAGRFPVSIEALAPVLFYLLKTKSAEELGEYYGLASLSHRAKRFAGECAGVEELVQKMKNASFTDSRIRRGLLALLCHTPRRVEKEKPAYSLILGAGEKGREALNQIKKEGDFPLFTKPAHALKHPNAAVCRQFSRAALADEIYSMAFSPKARDGFFLKKSPVIL